MSPTKSTHRGPKRDKEKEKTMKCTKKNPSSRDTADRLAAKHSMDTLSAMIDKLGDTVARRQERLARSAPWASAMVTPDGYMTPAEKERMYLLKRAFSIAEKKWRAGAKDRILTRRKARKNPAGDPPDPVYHGAVDRPERVPARAGDGDAVVVWREEHSRWECWVYDRSSRAWVYVDQGGKASMVRAAKEVVR